jgi:phenylalanyl-tRNA synthetase alpha chain
MNGNDPLSDPLADLDAMRAAGVAAFAEAAAPEQVEAVRVEFLGLKHGRVKAAQERLKGLEPSARKAYGQRFNAAKGELEAACEAARVRVEKKAEDRGRIDVTLPGLRTRLGRRHPLTQTAEELIDLFGRFGFAVARGPEVEDIRHNFDALNIPPSHPARDPLDNF